MSDVVVVQTTNTATVVATPTATTTVTQGDLTQSTADARYSLTTHAHSGTYAPLPGNVTNLVAPVYIAHRGGGADLFPDNTIEALDGGLSLGMPALDGGDLRLLSDGVLVSMHDPTTTTTTTTTGNASDQTGTSWQNLVVDAGRWFGGGWGNLKPTTFEQVLDRYGGRVTLFPEAKTDGGVTAGLTGAAIAAAVNSRRLGQAVVPGSFAMAELTPMVAAGLPHVMLISTLGTDYTPAQLIAAGIDHVALAAGNASNATISAHVAAGIKTYIYTLGRQKDRQQYLDLGVTGFYTDEPIYFQGDPTKYRRTTDPFKSGAFYHGHMASSGTLGPTPRGSFSAGKWIPGADGFILQGWGCPIAAAAGTYSITVTITFTTLGSDTSRWGGIAVCRPTDLNYQDGASSADQGYTIIMRANGTLAIFKKAGTVNTNGPSVATAAITAGNSATVRIDVTPTTITATRVDTAQSTTAFADATYRGGYFDFGRNSSNNTTGLVVAYSAATIA